MGGAENGVAAQANGYPTHAGNGIVGHHALDSAGTFSERFQVDRISFFVNGVNHDLRAGESLDPEMTVLEYLRQKGLTGTKLACGEGGCGACTVVCSRRGHDGRETHVPVNACLATVCELHGAHITTAEGLCTRDAKTLHPIPKAMADSHGSQCGYCTPGIVMSMYGLWLNSKEPTVADIEEHFDGNLCRCTGYRPILQAFQPFASDYVDLKTKKEVLPDDGPLEKRKPAAQAPVACCGHKVPASVGVDSVEFAERLQQQFQESLSVLRPPSPFCITGFHLGFKCEWFQPTELRDVLLVMSAGSNVKLQVGNTERRVEKFFKWNHTYPMTLVSLSQVRELRCLKWAENEVRLGAATPLQEISSAFDKKVAQLGEQHPQAQVLQSYTAILRWFAGHQIRAVAGLGGNIATASPISDLNPCHVAAGARLVVARLGSGNNGDIVSLRDVPMGDTSAPFFHGYRKTALGSGDVIVALVLPLTAADGSEYFRAYKQARRRDDDLAIVNAAMRVRVQGGVITDSCFAFGGMAPFTKACPALSAWWKGKDWNHDNFKASLEVLAADLPLPDGSPGGMCEYRRLLARSFYFKFWADTAFRLGHEAPPSPLGQRDMAALLEHTTSSCYSRPHVRGLQHFDRDQVSLRRPVSSPDKHMAADMQVIGRAKYTDDVAPALGEVFLDFVLSTKAHARILKIDASCAREVEGFVDIVTAADIKGERLLGPIAHDEEAICSEEVHCVGAIVAVVCAETRYAARVAAKAVAVEYEELPAVIGLEEAVAKNSFIPLLFQNPGEEEAEIHTVEASAGSCITDVFEAAVNNPRLLVVEDEIFMGGQEHFYLETNATRVEPNENGEFLIVTSSQNLHETQLLCAKALGVPLNKVTCQVKRLGGGFGGKESRCCLFSVPAAVAAQKLQRPVRFHMDRDVDQMVSGQRHSFLGRYRLAVDRESLQLVAADVQIYCNGGCSLDLSQPILNRGMFHITNACRVPNVRVRGHICRTNIASNTAFRGFGAPQGMFIGESMFERAASELRVSREELLQKNLYPPGGRTFFNHEITPTDVPLQRMWEQLMTQGEFVARRAAVADFNERNRYRKRGLAAIPTMFGISFTATHLNQAGALVHVQKDGTVLVHHGGVEMGQGLHTKIARVAASTLDIPIEAVYVKETSTDTVANTTATAASSGSDLNGSAVMQACEELKKRLEPFLEPHRELRDGPEDRRQEALAKAANSAFFARVNLTAQGYHRTPIRGVNWKQKGVNEFDGDPFWYYTFGVACSEVEVDCLTGDVALLRADIVHDVGRSLNAAIDIGQVEGAFTQGVGLFMMEEVVYDQSGRLCSKGPGMYKIPGFGDVPLDFRVRLLENHTGPAVLGSKAVGEPPLFLGSSAFFATKQAIHSARRDHFAEVAAATGKPAEEAGYFRLDSPATAECVRVACLDFLNPTGERRAWHARA